MTEHAMQSAFTAQSLTKGMRYEPLSPRPAGEEGKAAAAAFSCYFAAAIRNSRISATEPESDLILP